MISGLNQEVEVLGRTFHVQTELSRRGELSIRTEVFLGGKIVATREKQLSRADWDAGDEVLRTLMKNQHQKILTNVVERARRYQERQQEGLAPAAVPVQPETTAEFAAIVVEPEPEIPPPPADIQAEVSGAISIRRTFGEFRLRFDITHAEPHDDLVARLDKALQGVEWITAAPAFSEIRIDEQLRFNLVKEQLQEWVEAGKNPDQAVNLWSEIVTFNDYLTEVNNRAELVDFDRHLLVWAIHHIQGHGMTEQILGYLGLLYGRDPVLDRLLESPLDVTTDYWTALLRRVLSETEGGA